jgi:hypothetical protein
VRSSATVAGESVRKRARGSAANPASGTARAQAPAVNASTAQVLAPHATEPSERSDWRSNTAARERADVADVPVRAGEDTAAIMAPAKRPEATPEPVRAPVQPNAIAPNSEPIATTPRFASSGDTSELFVPISGSLAGLRAAVWVDPPALALDIPAGRITLPRTRYEIRDGGVQGLSFGRPHNVTQLRVYLTGPLTHYTTTEAPGGVTIRMKRDGRLQP